MRRRTPFLLALASTAVLLAACVPEAAPVSSTPTPTMIDSPSPTATPGEPGRLVIRAASVDFVQGDVTATAAFDDAAAVLALVEEATGERPEPIEVEDPPGYEVNLVRYDWEGLSVSITAGGTGQAGVVVNAPEIDGTPVGTEEGLSVGASRSDVVTAGGWDVWDEDGDGIADYLGVGNQEVPGTTSLSRPGETGIQYVMFSVADDLVTRITAPANDYSDL